MKLPPLVSGPILRRVTPDHVIIWLALTKPHNVQAQLYQITQSENPEPPRIPKNPRKPQHYMNSINPSLNPTSKPESQAYNYKPIRVETKTRSIRLGDYLYIYLLDIQPKSQVLPQQTLMGYNLSFSTPTQIHSWDLADIGLLNAQSQNSIVYGNLKYPTFYIDDQPAPNILYGSCRKLHGKGEDALAKGDEVIARAPHDLHRRPNALFMMGDQIYADDVAGPIFPFIQKLGKVLIGKDEPLSMVDDRLRLEPFRTSFQQINGRAYMAKYFCKFTSGHAENHLMTLSEYVAMYVLNWSPEAWILLQKNGGLPSFEDALKQNQIYFVFPNQQRYKKEHKKELEQLRERYNEQRENLLRFQKAVPQVRRLLANIPTYMIFDDHDVTDDWNLTEDWKKNVYTSPLGRHVVANALTAYWAFQAWGNNPDQFDTAFIDPIKNYLEKLNPRTYAYEIWCNQLWSYPRWYFVAPTRPITVFLDTRTRREYTPYPEPVKFGKIIEENVPSPELINREGWMLITLALKQSGYHKGDDLIVVAPSPFYGVELIENFFLKVIHPLRALGIPVQTTFDIEAWEDNYQAVQAFHNWLKFLHPGRSFILSGDVHYAYAAVSHLQDNDGYENEYIQLTSSPMKNMSFLGFSGFIMRMALQINAYTRKKRALVRYGELPNQIDFENPDTASGVPIKWKETINYLPSKKGKVAHIENNLGWLIMKQTNTEAQNTFLIDDTGPAKYRLS